MKSVSKEYIIVSIGIFLIKRVIFQSTVRNGCHYILTISIDIYNIVTLNIYGVDHHYIIVGISKSEAISLLKNLRKKSGSL